MILDVTFNVGEGVISFVDDTTIGEFTGVVTVTHPDGFIQTVNISDVTPTGTVSFRTDDDDNILQGVYVFGYVTDGDVDESDEIDFCYVAPTINLECKVDYLCSKLTITDKTAYNLEGVAMSDTTIGRLSVISYPTGTGLDDINSETQVTVVNPIYTGTFGIEFTATLEWDFGDYLVLDVLSLDKECKVDKGESLCSLNCCLQEAFKRWDNARCTNDRRASEFENNFRRVTAIATLAYVSLSCGSTKNIDSYVASAKKISGCDDCDCGDKGSGQLVVGLCGASASGEIDIVAGAGINIGVGGVVSVDAVWLEAFVDNIVNALGIAALQEQANTSVANIQNIFDLLEVTNYSETLNFTEIVANLDNLQTRLKNHNILSFSYRFSWSANTLTDNRDAENKVIEPNVTIMNGFGIGGWLDRPVVTWVNAATSNARAELQVDLVGIEELPPSLVFNHLNLSCEMGYRSQTGGSDGKVKPVVTAIGSNGENTVLRYKVQFYHEDVGYVTQSWLSANSGAVLGGTPHLSFFVTGKYAL